jgi:hypothetical protein
MELPLESSLDDSRKVIPRNPYTRCPRPIEKIGPGQHTIFWKKESGLISHENLSGKLNKTIAERLFRREH